MDYMKEALKEAYEGIENGHGGPFGAVIVKDNEIIGRGHNRVLQKHDPTCHGAIMWANITKAYYGCNVEDTDKIGFRDDKFYDFLNGSGSILTLEETDRKECKKLFDEYVKDKSAERY